MARGRRATPVFLFFPPPPKKKKKDKKAPASGSTGGGGFAELWLMKKKVFGRTAYQAGCALLAFFLPVMKQ